MRRVKKGTKESNKHHSRIITIVGVPIPDTTILLDPKATSLIILSFIFYFFLLLQFTKSSGLMMFIPSMVSN